MNLKLKILLDKFVDNNYKEFAIVNKTNNSWTNLVYELKTKENLVYFVRIKKHFQNKLENTLMHNFFNHDFFYDKNNSNMISEALINFELKISKRFVDFLINWINDFQNFGKNIENHSHFLFDEYLKLVSDNKLKLMYKVLYYEEFKKQELFLSHNDLSQFNLLMDKDKKFQIIDYEYAAFNLKYWDLFNFMRSLEKKNFKKMFIILIKKYNFSKQEIYKYLFLTTYYAYLWSVNAYKNFSKRSEIKKYTFETYNLSKKFFNKYFKLLKNE